MNLIKKILELFNSNKTYMEKEIFEQPEVAAELIRKYITKHREINLELPENTQNIVLFASGSSYNCAAIGADFLRTKAHCNAQACYASEAALTNYFEADAQTLYIFVSQSGETSDTNRVLEKIGNKTQNTMAITNAPNSPLYNNAKYKIQAYAGEEKATASTKAVLAQILCLFLTATKIMQRKEMDVKFLIDELINLPLYIKNTLLKREEIKKCASAFANYENGVILASGMFYPLAKEGALKIKETSYINITAYPTGEFAHGHIAVLNKKCAVILLVNNDNVKSAFDVIEKIEKNYRSDYFVITTIPLEINKNGRIINAAANSGIEFIFSALVILQLLALESAALLGRNIDFPSGLTKIVK